MDKYRLVAVVEHQIGHYDYEELTFACNEECRDDAQAVAWARSWAYECRAESMCPETRVVECYAVKVSELSKPEDEQIRHYLPYGDKVRLGIVAG